MLAKVRMIRKDNVSQLFLLVFLFSIHLATQNLIVAQARSTTTKPLLAVVTDDGYQSTYDTMLPYCRQYNIQMTVAIPWMNITSGLFENQTEMTWDEVKTLHSDGWCIAAHGTGIHVDFTALSESAMLQELNTSWIFRQNINITPETLVIPWSNLNDTLRLMAKSYYTNAYSQAGAKGTWSYDPIIDLQNDTMLTQQMFREPRYIVTPEWANKTNEATIISSAESAIDNLVSKGPSHALVLSFHQLTDSPRGTVNGVLYADVTPHVFQTIMDYARAQNLTFVTLDQLNQYLGASSLAVSGEGELITGSQNGEKPPTATTFPTNTELPLLILVLIIGIVVAYVAEKQRHLSPITQKTQFISRSNDHSFQRVVT